MMKQITYCFKTCWQLHGSEPAISHAIQDVERWQSWWPGLEQCQLTKRTKDTVGSQALMVWRARAGYRLSLKITITDFKPDKLLRFTSTGDLQGIGTWQFQRKGDLTVIDMTWEVQTNKPWMNLLALVLQPLFRSNHDHLMAGGELGLRKYLAHQEA